jgi:hypothetical protein
LWSKAKDIEGKEQTCIQALITHGSTEVSSHRSYTSVAASVSTFYSREVLDEQDTGTDDEQE